MTEFSLIAGVMLAERLNVTAERENLCRLAESICCMLQFL